MRSLVEARRVFKSALTTLLDLEKSQGRKRASLNESVGVDGKRVKPTKGVERYCQRLLTDANPIARGLANGSIKPGSFHDYKSWKALRDSLKAGGAA